MFPKHYFVLLSTLICCTLHVVHASDISAFIINGNEVADGSHPWQLSFQRSVGNVWQHTCGAILINERFALTASHCVYNRDKKNENGTYEGHRYMSTLIGVLTNNSLIKKLSQTAIVTINTINFILQMRVVAGLQRLDPLDSDGEIHYIERVITPFGLSVYYDVALLKLRTAANVSRPDISPIVIASADEYFTGRECSVTGWGTVTRKSQYYIAGNNPRPAPTLREASMTLITHNECKGDGWQVSNVHTCATGNPREQTGCFGDSGGPLSCTRADGTPVLFGVASFVYRRCVTTRPNVFAKASIYRRWIRQLTQINNI